MSREERKDAAASTIRYSERMYAKTSNPYYVLNSIYAAHWGEFTAPEWALDVLLAAVHQAMRRHSDTGGRISIDAALGLNVSRGKTTKEGEARKSDLENSAFNLVRVIHHCFDVSVPAACELVYDSVDFPFARSIEQSFSRPIAWDSSLLGLMPKEAWDRIQSQCQTEFADFVSGSGETDSVKDKLRSYDWLSVTRGDRLGYTVETLIDRYYRAGTKQDFGDNAPFTREQYIYFKGYSLLLSAEQCTKLLSVVDEPGYIFRSKSQLADLPKRPEFRDLCESFDKCTGSK